MWNNLVSDSSDNTNYIRGKKSGLETKLFEKAPHSLDIDGDVCHHIHNTVKKFCSPFNNFLERLVDDVHTDSKKVLIFDKQSMIFVSFWIFPTKKHHNAFLIGGFLLMTVLLL